MSFRTWPGLPDAEGRGRLVEDDDLAAERGGPGDRDGLALAAGQGLDRLGDVLERADPEVLELLPRPWRACRPWSSIRKTLPSGPCRRISRPRNMLLAMSRAGATASDW